MRILITGSRGWTDSEAIEAAMHWWFNHWCETHEMPAHEDITLVSGGAQGADHLAEGIATRMGWRIDRHMADWNTFGKIAGLMRNRDMVNTNPDVCLAFILDDSKGATHCAEAAEAAGIPTRVWNMTTQETL